MGCGLVVNDGALGLAQVNLDYKVCYIDKTGAVPFELPKVKANPFSEGMAAFREVP